MTFDFTYGNLYTTMDLPTLIIPVLGVGFYVWLIWWSLRSGILTLMGKPLNARPCPLFWDEVDAKILTTEEDEVWHEYLLNDIKGRSGIPNQPRGKMRKVSNFKVEYTYRDKKYQNFVHIKDFSGDAFQLYCLRWNPEQTKTYVPENSWSKGAGISQLLIGLLLALMGVITICGGYF